MQKLTLKPPYSAKEKLKFEQTAASEGLHTEEYDYTIYALLPSQHLEDGEIVTDTTFAAKELAKAKAEKHAQNIKNAKAAVENGFVTYKNAQFETNAQTVGDLTATMLLLQGEGENATYTWLSKDDKAVELETADFAALGALISQYKNEIWNIKYSTNKHLIDAASTLKTLENVDITY